MSPLSKPVWFDHEDILVICLTIASKLAKQFSLAYIIKHSDQNDLFFWSFQKQFDLWLKKN